MCHLRGFVQPRNGRLLRPPSPVQGDGPKLSHRPGRGARTASGERSLGRPPPRPLLGDALGQLGAGGRGVGREDSVAGAGGVHGRACGGAGSRGAESRGHGARRQQQQLPGHRPARGAVTAGPRGAAAGSGADGGRREAPRSGRGRGQGTRQSRGAAQDAHPPRTKGHNALRGKPRSRRPEPQPPEASTEAAAPSGAPGIREAPARAAAKPPSQMRAGRWATL